METSRTVKSGYGAGKFLEREDVRWVVFLRKYKTDGLKLSDLSMHA